MRERAGITSVSPAVFPPLSKANHKTLIWWYKQGKQAFHDGGRCVAPCAGPASEAWTRGWCAARLIARTERLVARWAVTR